MAMPPGPPAPGPGAMPAIPGGAMPSMNPAQMAAMQQQMQLMAMQAKAAAGKGMPYSPFPGMAPASPFPGIGGLPQAPVGGCGGMGMGMGMGMGFAAGAAGVGGKGFYEKGKGKGYGKGKGKSKFGKGKKGKFEKGEGKKGKDEDEVDENGEKVERKGSPIYEAQKAARMRFEKDVLDRIQGRWSDQDDEKVFYKVEGNTCSVTGSGEGDRVFHNKIMIYGHEVCWDARRFWCNLDLKALYAAGENVEKLEWNAGKESPETKTVVWLKAPDLPEEEEKTEEKKEEGEEEKVEEAKAD